MAGYAGDGDRGADWLGAVAEGAEGPGAGVAADDPVTQGRLRFSADGKPFRRAVEVAVPLAND